MGEERWDRYRVNIVDRKPVIGDFGEFPNAHIGVQLSIKYAVIRLNQLHNLVEHLQAENERLNSELAEATNCPDCNGRGKRWYSLYGDATCDLCSGSGKRR